jgi:beta-lactamase class A
LGLTCLMATLGATGFAITPTRVQGRAVDVHGQPVVGAAVRLLAFGASAVARTDLEGRFSVVGGYRLGSFELDISAPGFLTARQQEGAPTTVLHRAPIVEGRVVDDRGAGVAGAAVAVDAAGGGRSRQTLTDDAGLFWLRDLWPGPADLTVFLPRHDVWEARLILAADHIEQVVPTAARQLGLLDLVTNPPGAVPTVDGQPISGCPLTPCLTSLAIGDHAVTVTADAYVPWSQQFSLARDERVRMEVPLERKKGVLSIVAPVAAEPSLLLDGNQIGPTGWSGELPTGPHTISFRSADHWPWLATVNVEWQQKTSVTVAPTAVTPGDEAGFLAGLQAYLTSLGGQYGVWLQDLRSGKQTAYHGGDAMEAASVIKIPVALYLLDQARHDKLKLSDTVQLEDDDFMGGTGTLYYDAAAGDSYSYQDLLALLIQQSDNTAWMALDRVLDKGSVDAYAASIGASDCHQDDDLCTAQEAGLMLAKLASGSLLDAAGTSTLMHLLETTAFNDRINYYLGGFTIAHKVGMDGGVMNDAGVVYAGRPFVISMFTDTDNPDQGVQAIRDVARAAARLYSK